MDSFEAANSELLGLGRKPAQTRRPDVDETPRVLVIIHADGWVEALGVHGAKVLVAERWQDQDEVAFERTLRERWRQVLQSAEVNRGEGYPRGAASWRRRNEQLAQLESLQGLRLMAERGWVADRIEELAGVFQTDATGIGAAAKLLQLEESISRTAGGG